MYPRGTCFLLNHSVYQIKLTDRMVRRGKLNTKTNSEYCFFLYRCQQFKWHSRVRVREREREREREIDQPTSYSGKLAELAGLVAIGEHVPGVVRAFSSIGPFLTSGIFVAAVVTESTGLGTVGDHITAVLAAFSTVGPSLAGSLLVNTVGAGRTASSTTTSSLTTTTSLTTTSTTSATTGGTWRK